MKKASKILILLLVAVMVLGAFAGCGIFSKNTEKYRSTVALRVGNQEITIGKLIDTFNSMYNTYGSYVSSGYITIDYVFELTMSSLYAQYMKIDDYIQSDAKTYVHKDRGVEFVNQKYLDNGEDGVDELEYAIKYIKYVLFSTLDSMVEGYIGDDYTLNDAEEEKEDTSRDFTEYDDLGDATTYSYYNYLKNFENEDMDEYIEKYYEGILDTNTIEIDDYIYTDKTSEMVANKLKEYNDRIDGDDEITFDEYVAYQEQAVKQYKKNVQNNYKYDLNKLITRQVEDFIASAIVAKWNYSKYLSIDGTEEGLNETLDSLREDLEKNMLSQKTEFNINDSFITFIESLSSSSYIYDIPRDADGKPLYNYIYVKNILIPFTTEQTTILKAISNQLGTTDSDLYNAKLLQFASEVIAEDFNSEKDEDGNHSKISNIFALEDDKLVINTVDTEDSHDAYEAFGQYFTDIRVEESTIKDLMLRFNTDTAQHTAAFDYVVRVGGVPESYTAKWVPEFVDGANDAVLVALGWDKEIGEGKRFATREDAVNAITSADLAEATPGTYALAISSYGVHVVWFSGVVEEQKFDFDANWLDSSRPEYKLFTAYYSTHSSEVLSEAVEELQKKYFNGLIVKDPNGELEKFAKENRFKFDFEASITLKEDE